MTREYVTREEIDAFTKLLEDSVDTDIEEIDNLLADLKVRVDKLEENSSPDAFTQQLYDMKKQTRNSINEELNAIRIQMWLGVATAIIAMITIASVSK